MHSHILPKAIGIIRTVVWSYSLWSSITCSNFKKCTLTSTCYLCINDCYTGWIIFSLHCEVFSSIYVLMINTVNWLFLPSSWLLLCIICQVGCWLFCCLAIRFEPHSFQTCYTCTSDTCMTLARCISNTHGRLEYRKTRNYMMWMSHLLFFKKIHTLCCILGVLEPCVIDTYGMLLL